jgi:catechol 2,3-dioxygenase-like lactoylglutathione lyase family enzyme
MKASAILETVLDAADINAVESFYSEVLGLELHWKAEGHTVMFKCGNQMLLIFNPRVTVKQTLDGNPPVPPHGTQGEGHVCFRATKTEIDAWRARFLLYDVAIESEFDWPEGGHSLYVRDPAGNSVEFAEPSIWGFE